MDSASGARGAAARWRQRRERRTTTWEHPPAGGWRGHAGPEQGSVRVVRERESLIGIGRQAVEMTHLAAGPRLGLAVEMQAHAGSPQRFGPARLARQPHVAQEVDHGHRTQEPGLTQGQAAESAELLLELVHRARVHRVVPAVVRARGHLVDVEPPAVGDEQLHAQHPHVLHPLGDRGRERLGLRGQASAAREPGPRWSPGCRSGGDSPPTGTRRYGRPRPRARTTDSSVSSDEPLLQHAGHPAEPLERLHGRRRDRSPSPGPCRRNPADWS